MKTVELDFFVGKSFLLSEVDTTKTIQLQVSCKYDPDEANTMALTLDGTTYLIVEDPVDGYRSCLSEVQVLDDPGDMSTVLFPPINVTGRWGNNDKEFVELLTEDGHVFVEFGTDYSSDEYYPWFVAKIHPIEGK